MVAAVASSLLVLLVVGASGRSPTRRVTAPDAAHVVQPLGYRVGTHRRRWLGVGAVLPIAVILGLLPAIIIVIAVGIWPRVASLAAARSAHAAREATLPDAVEMLILVVHAGLTPHQAVEALASRAPLAVRPAFAEVVLRCSRGAALADAIAALSEQLGPTADPIADTIAIAERHGTPIAQTLEQLARDVRERRRRQAEGAARRLPIRMSFPLVACTLPSFVLVAIVPAVLAALSSLGDRGL